LDGNAAKRLMPYAGASPQPLIPANAGIQKHTLSLDPGLREDERREL
jgi:hypothetical protein